MFTLAAATASAQITTVPKHIGESRFIYKGDESPIDILTKHQKAGDWNRLHNYGLELLQTMAKEPSIATLIGNVNKNYYSLVWQSTGPDGKDVINRVLVHAGLPAQQSSRLPGIESHWQLAGTAPLTEPQATSARIDNVGPEVLDILLTDARSAKLTSAYVFTPTPDPLMTQLPDVVSKLNIVGFLATGAGTGDEAPSVLVYVNQPNIAMRRATIQIKDVITTPQPGKALTDKARGALASVKLRQARNSVCALAAAEAMKAAIDTTAGAPSCDNGGAVCAANTKAAVEKAFVETVSKCTPESGPSFGFDPVTATEQEFKNLVVAGGAQVVTGTASLTNTPYTRFSYGLMGALLVGHPRLKETRVKTDGGKLVEAPMDHTMTAVILNIHPLPYDAEWPRVSWAERFRVFGGATLTPDFGLTTGVGIGLVRGLSVNTGFAIMASNRLKSGEKLGEAPANKNDPFRVQPAVAAFIGFGYVFK